MFTKYFYHTLLKKSRHTMKKFFRRKLIRRADYASIHGQRRGERSGFLFPAFVPVCSQLSVGKTILIGEIMPFKGLASCLACSKHSIYGYYSDLRSLLTIWDCFLISRHGSQMVSEAPASPDHLLFQVGIG